jgi:hypothetical protein
MICKFTTAKRTNCICNCTYSFWPMSSLKLDVSRENELINGNHTSDPTLYQKRFRRINRPQVPSLTIEFSANFSSSIITPEWQNKYSGREILGPTAAWENDIARHPGNAHSYWLIEGTQAIATSCTLSVSRRNDEKFQQWHTSVGIKGEHFSACNKP